MADVAKIKSGLQVSNTVNRDGRSLGATENNTRGMRARLRDGYRPK